MRVWAERQEKAPRKQKNQGQRTSQENAARTGFVDFHREHTSFRNYRLVPDPTEVGVVSGWGRSGSLLLENGAHDFTCRNQHRESEKSRHLVMCWTSKTVYAIFEGEGRMVNLAVTHFNL